MDGLRPAPPEIIAVVDRLITAHFPDLKRARLVVMVRDKALEAGLEDGPGKVTVAATGVNSDDKSLPFDYLIWFALDAWQVINDGDREALVYHELTHAGRDEQGKPELKYHDAGVFDKEVALYGAWWTDAQKRFKKARSAGSG